MDVQNSQALLQRANEHIIRKDWSGALEVYQSAYLSGTFTSQTNVNVRTHARNAANLSRQSLYSSVADILSVTVRLKSALDMLVGLTPKAFANKIQQPSFFYVPDLPSQPFWKAQEINGLVTTTSSLKALVSTNLTADSRQELYLDSFAHIPQTTDWTELHQKWESSHLVKGGQVASWVRNKDSLARLIQQDPLLANCPPHAPEVFVSTLKPGAYIPPHFGISNIKLTVHIPIKINNKSSLTVGEESFLWSDDVELLCFDDSFLHSARNDSNEERTVLIFDIWHPELTSDEREAIRRFMLLYSEWNEKFGKLAVLDQVRR